MAAAFGWILPTPSASLVLVSVNSTIPESNKNENIMFRKRLGDSRSNEESYVRKFFQQAR